MFHVVSESEYIHRGCPCGGSPGGPVPWGSLDVWGPGLFRACFMPCGMGLLFPTHTINIYMEEPYEHKRAHTPSVHSSIHIGIKTGSHRHTLS